MKSDNKINKKNIEYKLQFARDKYKRIPLDIRLESYEIWKKAAEMSGLPLNTFIKQAVNEKIERIEKDS